MVRSKTNTAATIDLRPEIIGIDQVVPLLDGTNVPYVNLDNAASTPAFRRVQEKVNEALLWYSSVHRGSGYKSMLSTQLYEQARQIVMDFVGADHEHDCIVFAKNATEAINKLANRFPFEAGDIVLTTGMEHHSNDLPWRAKARVIHAGLLPDGALDVEAFQHTLEKYAGQIKLVAITGASNVTGYLPPIYDIAEMAHRHGAQIFVDCAQLLPHRKVDMGPHDSPRHLDFIAFSAHKIYAPLGSGGLIGPKTFFEQGEPDVRGGGTVEIVTLDDVIWSDPPEKDEAGSPNVIGAVALAASLQFLSEVGMDNLAHHEAELTRYALTRLADIPGMQIYGSRDPEAADQRVGVIPFGLDDMPPHKLASILSFEGGIGVRSGCFCAHPYILHLLGVTEEEYRTHHNNVLQHNRAELPGLVRMSFGSYNNLEDIDRLVEMLGRISRGEIRGQYDVDAASGEYYPRGFAPEALRGKEFVF